MAKKLYRSRNDRILGGVCGGIAEYFEIDPTLVRLAFLLVVFAGGAGFLAYIIGWIIIPERPLGQESRHPGYRPNTGNNGGFEQEEERAEGFDMKEQDGEFYYNDSGEQGEKNNNNQRIFGIILLILGGVFLLDNWNLHIHWGGLAGIGIIVLGIAIMVKGVRGNGR